jgi:hypothetical protein
LGLPDLWSGTWKKRKHHILMRYCIMLYELFIIW